MRRFALGLCVILAAALAGGCASRFARPTETTAHVVPDIADYPASHGILQGFDPMEPAGLLRAGDRALYGVTLSLGERQTTWYVLLEALVTSVEGGVTGRMKLPGGESRTLRLSGAVVLVRVYDRAGKPMGSSVAVAVPEFLRIGVYGACAAAVELAANEAHRALLPLSLRESEPKPPRRSIVRLSMGRSSLWPLVDALAEHTSLVREVAPVFRMPSLGSLVLNAGVKYDLDYDLKAAKAGPAPLFSPLGTGGTRTIEIDVHANGEDAMFCTLQVVEPAPPLMVSGGVVWFEACNAADPDKRVSVRLLAARRGNGEASVVPPDVRP